MEIHIDPATSQDVPYLLKTGNDNKELWVSDRKEWNSEHGLRKLVHSPQGDVIVIARANSQQIGMCLAYGMRDWAYIGGLFVEESYRGKGIGKKLLDEVARRMKINGVSSIGFIVNTDDTRAIAFYEREGFIRGYQFYWMSKNK